MTHLRISIILVAALALTGAARAQDTADEGAPHEAATLNGTVAALYDVISGPADEPRDWDRLRSLFHAKAQLVPLQPTADGASPSVLSVEDFIAHTDKALKEVPIFQGKGFYESESARCTETFADFAHIWSTYEGRLDPDAEPFLRGINSLQLYFDGSRWWIVSLMWEPEHEGATLPERPSCSTKP